MAHMNYSLNFVKKVAWGLGFHVGTILEVHRGYVGKDVKAKIRNYITK